MKERYEGKRRGVKERGKIREGYWQEWGRKEEGKMMREKKEKQKGHIFWFIGIVRNKKKKMLSNPMSISSFSYL